MLSLLKNYTIMNLISHYVFTICNNNYWMGITYIATLSTLPLISLSLIPNINVFSNSSDYNIILVNIIIIALIASLLLIINYFLRQKDNKWELNTQKYAAYECGFEPFSETQSHIFEIQFFLVSIMFLIFDIELALMFPWAVYFNFLNKFAFWIMIFFVILLTVGFFYEWKKGALNWNTLIIPSKKQFMHILFFGSYDSSFFINNLNFNWINEYSFAVLIVGSLVLLVILNSISTITEHVSRIAQQVVIFLWVLILFYYGIAFFFSNLPDFNFYINNYFISDHYTQICKIFILFCLLVIFYFCITDYMYYHKYIVWELPFILLLASWFMVLLVSSFNLFSLFISLEGLSLCLYVLAAYDFDRRSSTEAAIKYFTLGTLSSGFLLLGIVFIYITIGSLDYLTIYQCTDVNTPQPLLRIGSGLIFFSFLFKLGIWPCHQWVADVYTGVPTIITAIFSTSVKATIFFTLLRLYNYIIIEKPIMAVICIMSLLVGIFGALQTNKIKRFLAYAAINQMGFILLGVFTYSTDVVLIYFIFYILTTLMIFIIVLKTISVGTLKLQEIVYISDLKILSFYNPSIRIYLLIILFSMAGLPPFITALTKWYILLVLLSQYYVLLCGISIFLTIFSIYYYVRLVKHIFFEDIALSLINTRPIFYFKNTQKSTLFLNLSTFILCFGPVGLYIYIYDFLNFFTKLANFCSLNISTLLLFMLSFINIYGLLLIPLLTIILIYIGNKNISTKSIVNKENFLIMTFSAGLFLSFIYVLALYFLFKTDTSAYQFVSIISCSLNSFLLINIESLYNVISASLLAIDGLSIVFVILTPFIIFICAAITHQLPTSNTERSLYYTYLLLMELFLFLAFTTTNLLIFYFAFEATLLPIFLIIGRWGSNASKKQAANYIFLYTVAGSVLMLFAILSIITYSGTANFLALKSIMTFQNSREFSFWWWCFFIGFAVKIPMCPFHLWLPEAHVEAPAAGSVILAALLLKLGGYGFLRVLIDIFNLQTVYFQNFALLLALISVVWGCGVILTLTDIKRVIAFSSIIHMNLAVVGIFSLNYYGYLGALAVMIAHGLCSAGLFMCIGMLYIRYHTRVLPTLTGLARVMPIFALIFGFYSLANMSFPGTFNFISELLLLQGIFLNNATLAFFSLYGVIYSGIYSLGLFSRLSFGNVTTSFKQFFDIANISYLPGWYSELSWQLPVIFVIVFWGLAPKYFLALIDVSIIRLLI